MRLIPRRGAQAIKERRKWPRRPKEQLGRIVNGNGLSIRCAILNYSVDGARLELESITAIPDEFMLVFEQGIARRQCMVRWKMSIDPGGFYSLGVQFS
jgi:hypothetical protein